MPLLEIWNTNRQQVLGYKVNQLVAMAGNGELRDGTDCSLEFREILSKVPRQHLSDYVSHCLNTPFANSGLVLQDLVNELGHRLGYEIEPGLYRGKQNAVGNDGLWKGNNWGLVVEVKTTDTYRIDLEKIAEYRQQLIEKDHITQESSILIVVGRDDTGGLEAQIRGSRDAWDMRLISIDALLKLVKVKEQSASDHVVSQTHEVLKPMEYTRVDRIIDIVFDVAEDIENDDIELGQVDEEIGYQTGTQTHQITPRVVIEAKREKVAESYGLHIGHDFIRAQRALFESTDNQTRLCIVVSKNYQEAGRYWFRFDPKWLEYINSSTAGYYILSGVDLDTAYAIPVQVMQENIDNLNQTVREGGTHYWHIHLTRRDDDEMLWNLSGGQQSIPLSEYKFSVISEN